MKKFLLIMVTTALLSSLILVGCGSTTTSSTSTQPSASQSQSSQNSYSTVIMGAQQPTDTFMKKFNLSGSNIISAKESVILDEKKLNLDKSSMVIELYSMNTPLDSKMSQIFPNANFQKAGITDMMMGSSHRILIIGKDDKDLVDKINSLDKDWYSKANSKDMNGMKGM
ncbi:hypothetical protein ACHOLT_00725 [Desulfitobacterium sp. Sab5]|uniref:hypothetical protein n=1 Tax=Desulfitobacterium nosdiversum TaxID=3375356 RepID=UPI003CFA91AB